jgi:hypothetical protein
MLVARSSHRDSLRSFPCSNRHSKPDIRPSGQSTLADVGRLRFRLPIRAHSRRSQCSMPLQKPDIAGIVAVPTVVDRSRRWLNIGRRLHSFAVRSRNKAVRHVIAQVTLTFQAIAHALKNRALHMMPAIPGERKALQVHLYFRFFSYLAIEVEVLLLCPKRNVLRRENIRAKPYRCWESRGSLSPRRVRARSQI